MYIRTLQAKNKSLLKSAPPLKDDALRLDVLPEVHYQNT